MQVNSKINPSIIAAATGMLQPFIPELSPQTLVKALEDYRADRTEPTITGTIEKPLTRKQAAELLSVSMPTINRFLNRGTLHRVKISQRCVRIDPASVKALLGQSVEA